MNQPRPRQRPTSRGGGYWDHPSPFGFNRGPGYVRASLVFDTLVWRDASGETIPWLATDWSLPDDGLTWTFTLRDDVHWQDSQPLTAADVVFSIDYYKAHPGASWFMAQVNEIESATVVGESQVAVRLARSFAPFLQTTAEAMFIFPRHIWQDVARPQAFTEPEAFIGSGAYRLVEISDTALVSKALLSAYLARLAGKLPLAGQEVGAIGARRSMPALGVANVWTWWPSTRRSGPFCWAHAIGRVARHSESGWGSSSGRPSLKRCER